MQERLGRAATGPDFAVLQCTMSFCTSTGCGLSDPVTVSNTIWFLGGYCFLLSPRVISLLSFILSFVICSKYTGFQFLFLRKSMSRRLRRLTAAPTWIWPGAGRKFHLVWGGSWSQAVTQDPAMLKVCLQLEIPFLAWWQKQFHCKAVYMQLGLCDLYPFLVHERNRVKAKLREGHDCDGESSLCSATLHCVVSGWRKKNLEESPHLFKWVVMKRFL